MYLIRSAYFTLHSEGNSGAVFNPIVAVKWAYLTRLVHVLQDLLDFNWPRAGG